MRASTLFDLLACVVEKVVSTSKFERGTPARFLEKALECFRNVCLLLGCLDSLRLQDMRICFVSFEYPPDIIGGAGTYAETMVDGLRKSGVEVHVITRGGHNHYAQQTYRLGIDARARAFFFILPAMRLLRRLDKILEFDIVHFNEPHILLRGLGTRSARLPVICTLHSTQAKEIESRLADLKSLKTTRDIGDLILKNPAGVICDIVTARSVDKIICPSPALANEISSYCLIDRERISVVPNGIDLKTFDRENDHNSTILSKYGLEKESYLLFMGRLSTFKGIQYLIQAFQAMKQDYANLKLAIVGSGDIEYFRNLASDMTDIVFTGHVSSMADRKFLYENSALVVLPSLYEGLPMVLLEAMACRKAVVASNVGGVPFLINHGKNGFLVEPRNPQSLEQSIRILLENPDLRMKMGHSGRRIVEEKFTVEKMIDGTLKVYKEAR